MNNPYRLANRRDFGLQIVQGRSHLLLSLDEIVSLISDLQDHVAIAHGQKRSENGHLQATH